MNELETLRARHPWPDVMPNLAEDWHGWLCGDTANTLVTHLSPETKLTLECGSWLGFSARAVLQNAPNAHVICIDTWLGSPEHQVVSDWTVKLPTLYETCQRNLWAWKDRATLIRADSLVGLAEVFQAGLQPELIYLDSKHTTGRVIAELSLCLELFPSAHVVLDDCNQPAVSVAADSHVLLSGRPVERHEASYYLPPWRQI